MTEFEFVQCIIAEDGETSKESPDDSKPMKSSTVYHAAYQKFIKWCKERNLHDYSENVLLEYFTELETTMKMKSSSMWSQYSMIKSLLISKNGLDISKYLKLREYLKKQNQGYTPKKSRGFTRPQFEKFLSEASDDMYLGMKIMLIIGVSGACRCEEMVKMRITDIEDLGSLLHIKIAGSKSNKTRSFTVAGENSLRIYRKYISLRPVDMNDDRLFLKHQNGKCHRLVMGIHKIGSVPKEIASYLKLPHWQEYTGHCFKRTSAMMLEYGEISY